jgi:uncharacterized protein (TIGR03435 family)
MSTGHRKQASRAKGSKSHNHHAITHGMLSSTIVLNGESTDRFLTLLAALLEEFQPQTHFEESLIENMAVARWRQMRIWGIEKAGMEQEMRRQEAISNLTGLDPSAEAATRAALAFRTLSDDSRSLELINRCESRYDRQYYRAHRRFVETRGRRTPPSVPGPPPAPAPVTPAPPAIPQKVIIHERTPEVTANKPPVEYNRSIMHCVRLAFAALLTVSSLSAQAPDLQFEVASLKPSKPGAPPGSLFPAPGRQRYVATGASLRLFITVAYRVRDDQVSGGPGWLTSDYFDMNARAERPSSIEELHGMLRNLIKERFKLRMHVETKEHPVYVLTVDKTGVKMTPRDIASTGDALIQQSGPATLTARFTSMDYFAWLLSFFVDRPILDRTGLKGVYDFNLSWNSDLSADLPGDTSGPGIFEALRKQLGLRLEPQNGPLEILVIDHAEKPAEN